MTNDPEPIGGPIGDPQPVNPISDPQPLPVPVLVDAGPNTLQWTVSNFVPETAQVEYSTDGVSWSIFDSPAWGADTDINTSGFYRVIGLTNGQPVTQYSNVIQL